MIAKRGEVEMKTCEKCETVYAHKKCPGCGAEHLEPTQIRIILPKGSLGYVRLPAHKGPVARSVPLRDLLSYDGSEIVLDLDAEGRLMGIEVMA